MQHVKYDSILIPSASYEQTSTTESGSVNSAPMAHLVSSNSSFPPTPVTTAWPSNSSLGVSSSSGFVFQNMPLLRHSCSSASSSTATKLPVFFRPESNAVSKSYTTGYTFASPIRRPPSVATELVKLSSHVSSQFAFSNPIRSRSSSALFPSQTEQSAVLHPTPISGTGAPTSHSPIFTLIVNSDANQDSQVASKGMWYFPSSPRFKQHRLSM